MSPVLSILPAVLIVLQIVSTKAGPIAHDRPLYTRETCTDGAWSCDGDVLQECSYGAWITSQTCGTGLVCSATGGVIGCVYPWQVQQAGTTTSTVLSTAALPTSTTVTPPTGVTATSISTPSPTSTTPVSSSGLKYNVYLDWPYVSQPPAPSALGDVTTFIMSFWMSSVGPVDIADGWVQLTADQRTTIKNEYAAAGKKLMVAAFGSTDTPTSSGLDPTTVAQELAAWVIEYDLDGADCDYEDFDAMNGGTATAWLITFQNALRASLGNSYIISHAPVAPWFSANYAGNGYLGVYESAGSGIDYFNIQFYNQGVGTYDTCNELLVESGTAFPNTAVAQIISLGVPADKIVIGKPTSTGSASNGYMTPAVLASCLLEAKQMWSDIGQVIVSALVNHWISVYLLSLSQQLLCVLSGLMWWQWDASVTPSFISAAEAALA